MNSTQKGLIGESHIITEFLKRGINISIPFGNNTEYDLVAEINGELKKIQVKMTGAKSDDNEYSLPVGDEKDIDYLAYYIQERDYTFLVPKDEVEGKSVFILRFKGEKSNSNFDSVLSE